MYGERRKWKLTKELNGKEKIEEKRVKKRGRKGWEKRRWEKGERVGNAVYFVLGKYSNHYFFFIVWLHLIVFVQYMFYNIMGVVNQKKKSSFHRKEEKENLEN
jgi:hypothetical protein